MRVEKFKATSSQKLSNELLSAIPELSYNSVQKLIRNKDVKVNGARVKEDIKLSVGDTVECYLASVKPQIEIIYEDDNIAVCFKPRKIEVTSETEETDLRQKLSDQLKTECFAVHRLDRNTEGLVIFAKNNSAKNSLDFAIKQRNLEKYYLALVHGKLERLCDDMTAYLKKDSARSLALISDTDKAGYEKIETKYKLIEQYDNHALVEVELITGKTHQIRAHFAHIGHFVIGDEKYGDSKINKEFKKKYQCLCAYRLVFHFGKNDFLSYLDGKIVELDKNKIDFINR